MKLSLFCVFLCAVSSAVGCGLIGFRRIIEIDGCNSVSIDINACKGCCQSTSYSSDLQTIARSKGKHNIISKSSCCVIHSMMELTFAIRCGGENVTKKIFTATECRCGLCEVD